MYFFDSWDRKTSSLWLALWLLCLFFHRVSSTMLYIQGQELRDTGDDLMAVNADETQPDLAGMGVRGITEWEWNSVEWGNFFIIEWCAVAVANQTSEGFYNFWHRCIMLIIQIHLVFSDRSKVSRLLFICPCQGWQNTFLARPFGCAVGTWPGHQGSRASRICQKPWPWQRRSSTSDTMRDRLRELVSKRELKPL